MASKDAVIKGVRRGQKNSLEAKSKNVKGFKNTGTFVSFYMKEKCSVVIEILSFRQETLLLNILELLLEKVIE